MLNVKKVKVTKQNGDVFYTLSDTFTNVKVIKAFCQPKEVEEIKNYRSVIEICNDADIAERLRIEFAYSILYGGLNKDTTIIEQYEDLKNCGLVYFKQFEEAGAYYGL